MALPRTALETLSDAIECITGSGDTPSNKQQGYVLRKLLRQLWIEGGSLAFDVAIAPGAFEIWSDGSPVTIEGRPLGKPVGMITEVIYSQRPAIVIETSYNGITLTWRPGVL
jgi:hypothetical protein